MPEKPLGKEGPEEKLFDCASLAMRKLQGLWAANLIWALDHAAHVRILINELRST